MSMWHGGMEVRRLALCQPPNTLNLGGPWWHDNYGTWWLICQEELNYKRKLSGKKINNLVIPDRASVMDTQYSLKMIWKFSHHRNLAQSLRAIQLLAYNITLHCHLGIGQQLSTKTHYTPRLHNMACIPKDITWEPCHTWCHITILGYTPNHHLIYPGCAWKQVGTPKWA